MKIVVNLTSVPFVLGLIVELEDCYIVTSNRESGFGRYDVMLEPRDKCDDAFIIEFKVLKSCQEEYHIVSCPSPDKCDDYYCFCTSGISKS